MNANRLRLTLSILMLLFTANALLAQNNYDFYLQKAQELIAEGDCDGAQKSYNVYKIMAEKSNAEIERQLEKCIGGAGDVYNDLVFTVNGVSFTMKLVEGGTFQMGATSEQGSDASSDEKPVHSVTLSDYYIGETEVTQALWKAVMGSNPSCFKGDNLPVEQVDWDDCQEFIRKLNQKTGKNFRLPTEAEWEYAARGGRKSKGYKYAGSNTIGNIAWYADNSGWETHPVKGKAANELGLYDMSGNVWEYCQDWFGDYSSGSQSNPSGPSMGSFRVRRGGSWGYYARDCRVSSRWHNYIIFTDHLGFRLALPQ